MLEYLLGATALGAVAMHHAIAPTSQFFGSTFRGLPPGHRMIALTYDDGPNEQHTEKLLEVLAKYGAKATFFVLGRYVQRLPQLVRATVDAGHAVGNHTFTHPNLLTTSALQTRIQLQECRQLLVDAAGVETNLFRPPFGCRGPQALRQARALGFTPVMWSITGGDWRPSSAEALARRIGGRIRGGDVVLLHDGSHRGLGADRSATVGATERLLARFTAEGYTFVTIPTMLAQLGA